MDIDAGEAVLRQHLAERRRDRDPPLGVEAVGEIRKKIDPPGSPSAHEPARPKRAEALGDSAGGAGD